MTTSIIKHIANREGGQCSGFEWGESRRAESLIIGGRDVGERGRVASMEGGEREAVSVIGGVESEWEGDTGDCREEGSAWLSGLGFEGV